MGALASPTVRAIIAPLLDDVDRKLAPGMELLSWTSLNIDGYLHRVHQVTGAGATLCALLAFHCWESCTIFACQGIKDGYRG